MASVASKHHAKVCHVLKQFPEVPKAVQEHTLFEHGHCSLQTSHEKGGDAFQNSYCQVWMNAGISPKTLWHATFNRHVMVSPLMIYTKALQITLFNLLQTHMKYCENVSLAISGEMLAVR